MALKGDSEGLTGAEAAARLLVDGPNELPSARRVNGWVLLFDVVAEPMFLLLAACGTIYLALGDGNEAPVLLGFVAIVIAITFAQQRRTERSRVALRDLSCPRALVIRDGRQQRIAGRKLVAGDVVLFAEGDWVPADIDLLQDANLRADESMLTGESIPVLQHADAPEISGHRVHSGTLITQGTASGVVVATGAAGALVQIGVSLAAIDGQLTPIQQETRRVVKAVANVCFHAPGSGASAGRYIGCSGKCWLVRAGQLGRDARRGAFEVVHVGPPGLLRTCSLEPRGPKVGIALRWASIWAMQCAAIC